MKKNLLMLALLVSLSAMAQNEKSFSIKGSYTNITMPVQKVYLSYRAGDKSVIDSAVPVDGHYAFAGKITDATPALVRLRYQPGADGKSVRPVAKRDYINIFLGADNMDIVSVDSFANATVKGSKTNDDFVKLTAAMKPSNDRMQKVIEEEYSPAAAAKNEPARKAAEAKLDAMQKEQQQVYGDFAKNNINSPVALYAVSQYAGWDIDVPNVEPLFNQLPSSVRETPGAKQLSNMIAIAKKTSVGQMAMDFTQNDTLGVPVKLSSLKGKYLLVDFWASWCGPCRRENPNVVLAYNQFKDKGFTILGVSLDRPEAKDNWIKAIHDDNLTWTHVSDLKYWQNDVAKLYGVQAIPQNYLLDPTGKIVAKNLSGEQLKQKLAELLP